MKTWLKGVFLAFLICCGFIAYFYFKDYLTLEGMKVAHMQLALWNTLHPVISILIFMIIDLLAAICCMPGIAILSFIGGFIFGYPAIMYIVVSKSLGAWLIFLLVQTTFGDWITQKAGPRIKNMEMQFRKNAFHYLIFLRLIPIFPFWIINVGAAIFEVKPKIFLLATSLGIIPGTIIYVIMGRTLKNMNTLPSFEILFNPHVFIPLALMGFLALLPLMLRRKK